MSIYTGRGDDGETDLRDMTRVSKASSRIEAYGTVDELNALIGTIRDTGYEDVDDRLRTIQNHLHVVQADFADPRTRSGGSKTDAMDDSSERGDDGRSGPAIDDEHVEHLESWIDDWDDELAPLTSFVLPTGSESGAKLHHARAVSRRAERRAVELAANEPVNDDAIRYLNRLSDALFTFARVVNQRDGEPEESPAY